MTRFAADSRADRLALVADGIRAHAQRDSPFVTVQAEPGEAMAVAPWVQYSAVDGLVNLDCRNDELDAVESAIDSVGGASVAEQTSPEDSDGTNLRITIHGDPERVAMLIEAIFREGFGLAEDYRLWVVEL